MPKVAEAGSQGNTGLHAPRPKCQKGVGVTQLLGKARSKTKVNTARQVSRNCIVPFQRGRKTLPKAQGQQKIPTHLTADPGGTYSPCLLRHHAAAPPPLTRRHSPGRLTTRGTRLPRLELSTAKSPRCRQCSTWQCCPTSNSAIARRRKRRGYDGRAQRLLGGWPTSGRSLQGAEPAAGGVGTFTGNTQAVVSSWSCECICTPGA